MIEKCLIEHCAPTLASLKAANLFNTWCEEGENLEAQLAWFMFIGKNSLPGI